MAVGVLPARVVDAARQLERPLQLATHLDELPGKMRALGGGLPVLLIHAPADAPVGVFMPAVRLLRESQSVIYVFANAPEHTP